MTYASEVLADSPLFWGRLNESAGTVMTDSSGNGVNGTYSGATLAQAGLHANNGASALGGASGQGVGSTSAASFGTDESFGVEFWTKINNTNDPKGLVSRWSGGHGWIIWQRLGYLTFTVLNSAGQQDRNDPSLNLGTYMQSLNKHVVVNQNGTSYEIYLDKVLKASGSLSGTYSSGSMASSLQIGGYNGSNYSQANFADVAYYSNPLSAARVAAHFNAASVVSGFSFSGGWGLPL